MRIPEVANCNDITVIAIGCNDAILCNKWVRVLKFGTGTKSTSENPMAASKFGLTPWGGHITAQVLKIAIPVLDGARGTIFDLYTK